jgi:hypothetical protein
MQKVTPEGNRKASEKYAGANCGALTAISPQMMFLKGNHPQNGPI